MQRVDDPNQHNRRTRLVSIIRIVYHVQQRTAHIIRLLFMKQPTAGQQRAFRGSRTPSNIIKAQVDIGTNRGSYLRPWMLCFCDVRSRCCSMKQRLRRKVKSSGNLQVVPENQTQILFGKAATVWNGVAGLLERDTPSWFYFKVPSTASATHKQDVAGPTCAHHKKMCSVITLLYWGWRTSPSGEMCFCKMCCNLLYKWFIVIIIF